MSINFKDFTYEQNHSASNEQNKQNTKSTQEQQPNQQNNNYEELINKYKGMDNNSLMNELFSQANSLKQQGKLNSDSLTQLQSVLMPMLNEQQQQLLKNLIENLK